MKKKLELRQEFASFPPFQFMDGANYKLSLRVSQAGSEKLKAAGAQRGNNSISKVFTQVFGLFKIFYKAKKLVSVFETLKI